MPLNTPPPGAWVAYALGPPTAGAGTFGAASVVDARYLLQGKLVHVYLEILITTNGTGSSHVLSALPFAGLKRVNLFGREAGITGHMLLANAAAGSASLTVVKYDNTYPAVDGARLVLQGTYEIG